MKHIAETLLEYANFLGVKKIDELPGLWEHRVDEQWTIKCNGHLREVEKIPPLSWYIEYNGWPAGILSVMGDGVLCAGEGANEKALQEAINKQMQ